MTVTKDDFEKVWACQSPLTPYSFSDSQYKEGWNFVGATPPSRQMWDAFMQNADEKLKYLYQHEDIPLGHEYFTFNPNIPQGSLPLFGGEYSRETYADLWNWVQQQTGYLKTEAEWQTLSTANNGNVPFYSDGDGSTTFRVPSLKCWVKGANGTVSEVGSYLAAGLPNITGGPVGLQNVAETGFALGGYSGAFTKTTTSNYSANASQYGTTGNLKFDASLSNPIYGNANTVVPESIVGMWLVKAYGVIVDAGQIDEQAYIDDRFNAGKQYTDDKIAPIGTIIKTETNNVGMTSGQPAVLCSVSLSAGVWVINGKCEIGTTHNGNYGVKITDETGFSFNDNGVSAMTCTTGTQCDLNATRIYKLTEAKTIYLTGYTSGGNSTTYNNYLEAVRII